MLSKELDSVEKSKHLVENVYPEIAEKQQATYEKAISGTFEVMQNFATALTDHGIAQQSAAVDLRLKRTSVEIRNNETLNVYNAFDKTEDFDKYGSSDSFDKIDRRTTQMSISGEPYLQEAPTQSQFKIQSQPEVVKFEAKYDFDGTVVSNENWVLCCLNWNSMATNI